MIVICLATIGRLKTCTRITVDSPSDEKSRQKAKIWFLSISGGLYVTRMHDKVNLITYLYTQGGL